ncbi:hypothetical protein DVE54_06960 [Campylobacter upsaliensis]|nr:hypothetical protein [Campylobacter upsaliensis]EAL7774514.1 hypothetical protein [Campylobacter upsaliensis]
MTEYGRFILEELGQIKEKNELIKSSKLDFKSFNEYRIMLHQIENFDINKNYSDNELLNKLNHFISKVDTLFEKLIVENSLRTKPLFDYTLSSDVCFYEALKQIKIFTQKEDFSKEELGKFLEEFDELLLNKNFDDNQAKLLEQSLELFKEEFVGLLEKKEKHDLQDKDEPDEMSNEQKNSRNRI